MKVIRFIFVVVTIRLHEATDVRRGDLSDGVKNKLFSVRGNELKNTHSRVLDNKEQINNNDNNNTETRSLSQKLLESPADVHDYIVDKVNEIYAILKELDESPDKQRILINSTDYVPNFTDPFNIGTFNKSYKLANMKYKNVRVYGMSGFKNYLLSIDQANRKANVTLIANQLKIEGNYTLSNFLRQADGMFEVTLTDNVTYNERDVYYMSEDDVDIAAAEATVTYGKSQSRYENIGVLAHLFEGVISNKLTEEVLYRVGRKIGYKIRHVTTSKIYKSISSRNVQLVQYDRIAAIVRSAISEIRMWLVKAGTIGVPLTGPRHEIKVRNNYIHISNVTLNGLSTMHLIEDVKTELNKDNFRIDVNGEVGPFVISGQLILTKDQNSEPVSVMVNAEYEVTVARVKLIVSDLLRKDDDNRSFRVIDSNVTIMRPSSMKMKSDQMKLNDVDLLKLAQFLKPDIESQLCKWLKQFVDDIFRRIKTPRTTETQTETETETDIDEENFYS